MMNNRIFTKLYKKAWGHFPCPTGEPELEKFAELMLAECKSILLDMLDNGMGDGETVDLALTLINDHFGVEE